MKYYELIKNDIDNPEVKEISVEGSFNKKVECERVSWDPNECVAVEINRNCLVLDAKFGWDFETLFNSKIPPDASVFNYIEGTKPQPVYLLIRDHSGTKPTLKAYHRPKSIKTPPELLYMLLHWYETKTLFGAKYPELAKYRQGIVIGIIILLIVFLWLIASG